MPTVNVYISNKGTEAQLQSLLPELKPFLAKQLTCGDRKLQSNEISLRIHMVNGQGMIAPLELEINAHAYGDRISNADKICLAIRQFIMNKITSVNDVRAWLILSELGHSWEE